MDAEYTVQSIQCTHKGVLPFNETNLRAAAALRWPMQLAARLTVEPFSGEAFSRWTSVPAAGALKLTAADPALVRDHRRKQQFAVSVRRS